MAGGPAKRRAPAATASRRRAAPASAEERDARREILAAALELFARDGFAGVSNKEIGRRCGRNAALIYYYFENKEALFLATLREAAGRTLALSRALLAETDDPEALLRSWFQSHREMRTDIQRFMKIMVDLRGGPRAPSPEADAIIDGFYAEEIDGLLAHAIGIGVRAGRFRPVEARRVARFVSVHLDGILIAAIVRQDFDDLAALDDLEAWLFATLGHPDVSPA